MSLEMRVQTLQKRIQALETANDLLYMENQEYEKVLKQIRREANAYNDDFIVSLVDEALGINENK